MIGIYGVTPACRKCQ